MKFSHISIMVLFVSLVSCTKEYEPVQITKTNNGNSAVKTYGNYPAARQMATLAFEDSWPILGDTDMNDLVVNYSYRFGKDENGDIVQLLADFTVVASGASFQNGLGIELPIAPSLIQSVSGQRLDAGYIKTNANGTEAGQTNTVIVPFDNHENLLHYYDYSYFINVLPSKRRITGDTAHIVINFTQPINRSLVDKAPFNPFLISNMHRGTEVHLAGGKPTDKADKTLFNTGDDDAKSGTNYVAKNKFPWALNFTNSGFYYPVERAAIASAYLHYADWVQSGGKNYTDWYSNTQNGYRNDEKIFY